MNPVDLDLEEILKHSTFLSSLSRDQIRWLIQNSECISLETRQVLITENVIQDGFYIVIQGEFEIVRQAREAEAVISNSPWMTI